MEIAGRQAVLGQIVAQLAAETGRSAEPDVTLQPVWILLADLVRREPTMLPGHLIVDRGWRLIATARDRSRVADLAEKAGDRVLALDLDVGLPHRIEVVFAAAKERFGRIDVLVNNATTLSWPPLIRCAAW